MANSTAKYKIGDYYRCPVCFCSDAKIIWISKDGEAIGVQCSRSHFIRDERRFGRDVTVRKTGCVMILPVSLKGE